MADSASILIVDDDADQLFITRHLVERCGRRNPIVGLLGGAEAIAYLERCCRLEEGGAQPLPALVLLDLRMPLIDGLGVLRWIKSNSSMDTVRVIMLTSSDDPEDVKRCTEAGAHGYLVKHPNALVMGCVLRQALEQPSPSTRLDLVDPKPMSEPGAYHSV